MPTKSYWTRTSTLPEFGRLQRDLRVDVVVVGGGNTGVTAAWLLKQAGKTVALIERDRLGGVDTSHTSAHLTYVTDLRLRQLFDRLGGDHAQAVLAAGEAAINQIEANVNAQQIECGFSRVPGYLHASLNGAGDEAEALRAEAALAQEMGFAACYVEDVPLFGGVGVRFANQARFHPLQYQAGLLAAIPGEGCHVFERTEAAQFPDDADEILANGHTLKCDFIVIATDVPLMGKASLLSATLLQSKIVPHSSYVIGARLPRGSAPDGLFWDTSDPYFFTRIDPLPDADYVIFGGADHKTGQEADPASRFRLLESKLKEFLPAARIEDRWSGQVIESIDGLPYLGRTTERQFIATGFSGNGLTFGTLGAMMACDAVLGRPNPWQDLFDVRRKELRSAWDYLRENADYPYYMLKDRIARSEVQSLQDVKPGEGKLLKLDGKRAAVYRDAQGNVTKLSPVCTHMGCLVNWNEAEATWDCPCHGSRFRPTGEVLAGPAETPLSPINES